MAMFLLFTEGTYSKELLLTTSNKAIERSCMESKRERKGKASLNKRNDRRDRGKDRDRDSTCRRDGLRQKTF